jgi:predicted permease
MNGGYLLARHLGGDAELCATATALQIVIAFFITPAVLAATAQTAG